MKTFKDKNIWIIGASTGIGAALARELSDEGATIAISARSQKDLEETAKTLKGRHYIAPFDVTDLNDFKKTAENLRQKLIRIDSVVLLAGIYDPKLLKDMDIEKAHAITNVNFNGALNCINVILPLLKYQGYGQLCLTGSVAGYRGLPKGQPYSATKAAITNLVESLRIEEPEVDVRLISPGFVKTPMTDKNDFEMPMVIEPEEAAQSIAKGMLSNSFEIHIPKKFTYIMKFIRIIPNALYFTIGKKMMDEITKKQDT
jgi:short-subunit dehydrogenase